MRRMEQRLTSPLASPHASGILRVAQNSPAAVRAKEMNLGLRSKLNSFCFKSGLIYGNEFATAQIRRIKSRAGTMSDRWILESLIAANYIGGLSTLSESNMTMEDPRILWVILPCSHVNAHVHGKIWDNIHWFSVASRIWGISRWWWDIAVDTPHSVN